MKYCPNCGAQNRDDAMFCAECGTTFENVQTQPQNNAKSPNKKNKWLSIILNFIGGMILYCLCGIGHIIHLRLYNRGLLLGAAGLIISIIGTANLIFGDSYIISLIASLLGLALIIYSMYDAYKCSEAINEGGELPLLFGFINPEELSQTKIIAAVIICLIAFIALMGIYMASPTEPEPISPILDTGAINQESDIKTAGTSDDSLQIKITYPGEWSASVGDSDDSTQYKGNGDETINIDDSDYDIIAAAVQKTDSRSDRLEVEIIKDGKTLDSDSTSKEYGVVTVSANI